MIQAIVLAGGNTSSSLQNCTTESKEALIQIGSKRMIEFVLAALQNSRNVRGIIVVGPSQIKPFLPAEIFWQPAGQTLLENLQLGLAQLQPDIEKALIVTVDAPLLTGPIIDRFLEQCAAREADLYYPIITKEICEQKFPGIKRTYVNLKEGIFTGGNLVLIQPGILAKCRPQLEELINNRKRPLKMVKVFGPYFLMKFLLQQLSIADLEGKVANLFKIRAKAVISADPEIGVDIDKALDWELANKLLG